MIKNSCCENTVFVDSRENKVHMIFDYLNWFERGMDDIPGIQELRPEVYDFLLEKIKSGTLDTQLYHVFTHSLKHAENKFVPEDEEQKKEFERRSMSNHSRVRDLKYSFIDVFETMKKGFLEVNGKGFGYRGLLTMNGKRLIQYNHFNDFLDETPELHRTILKKLLTKYLAVYPKRKELSNRIKDFYSETTDLFISLDENHELVMDVFLLPIYLVKDDKHFLNIAAKIIPSDEGISVKVNEEEISKTPMNLFSQVTATTVEVDPNLSPEKKYRCSDIWKKELRAMLPIMILLSMDENPELRKISRKTKDSMAADIVNYVYMIIEEGIPVKKSKLNVLLKSVIQQEVPELLLHIVHVLCTPDETIQPIYLPQGVMIGKTRIDFDADVKRILAYMN